MKVNMPVAKLCLLTILCVTEASRDPASRPTHFDTQPPVRSYGWLQQDELSAVVRGSGRCNIDKRPNLSANEFDAHYRDKRPVILGSSSLSLNLTWGDLESYLTTVGPTPMMTFTPVGRPHVGAQVLTAAEHFATYTTASEREAADEPSARARHASFPESVAESSLAGAYHVSAMSLRRHRELVDTFLIHRYRNTNASLHSKVLVAAAAGKLTAMQAGSKEVPSLANPALCVAHGAGGHDSCDCEVNTLAFGYSGAGAAWHWHTTVAGNEIMWGQKRWFLSRSVPPGGFNHRKTILEWVKEVYVNLPESVFEAQPLPGVGAAASPAASQSSGGSAAGDVDGAYEEPALFECILSEGEVMYFPNGWYHATLDIGHAIAVAYDGCASKRIDAQENALNRALGRATAAGGPGSSEPMAWVPPPLMEAPWSPWISAAALSAGAAAATVKSAGTVEVSSDAGTPARSASATSGLNPAPMPMVPANGYHDPTDGAARVRAFRQIHASVNDASSVPIIGAVGAPVTADHRLIVSEAAKAILFASTMKMTDNGLSLSLDGYQSVDNVEGEALVGHGPDVPLDNGLQKLWPLEHMVGLFPSEPYFLLEVGRTYLRIGRDWIAETYGPKGPLAALISSAIGISGSSSSDAGSHVPALVGHSSQRQQQQQRSKPAVLDVDPLTGLPQGLSTTMGAQALQKLAFAAKLNPLAPDAFALLAYAAEARAGDEGWMVRGARQKLAPGSKPKAPAGKKHPYAYAHASFHLLDVALAAARRALHLDPTATAVCNHIALLIAKGAVDRYRYDGAGILRFRSAVHLALEIAESQLQRPAIAGKDGASAATGSERGLQLRFEIPDGSNEFAMMSFIDAASEYHKAWSALRGSTQSIGKFNAAEQALHNRRQRVYSQLLRCSNVATDALTVGASAEALKALTTDYEATSQAILALIQARLAAPGTGNGWYDAHKYSALEVAAVMKQLSAASVSVDGGSDQQAGVSAAASAAQEEVSTEHAEATLPLYLPTTRRSSLLGKKHVNQRLIEVAYQQAEEREKLQKQMPFTTPKRRADDTRSIEAGAAARDGDGHDDNGQSALPPLPFLPAYAAVSESYRRHNDLPMYMT